MSGSQKSRDDECFFFFFFLDFFFFVAVVELEKVESAEVGVETKERRGLEGGVLTTEARPAARPAKICSEPKDAK